MRSVALALAPATTAVIAHRQPLIVEGLSRGLSERHAVSVVACCGDGMTALAAICSDRPDIALLELGLPLLDSRSIIGEIRRRELPTRTIVVSRISDPAVAHALIVAGAHGFVISTSTVDEIGATVRDVMRGAVSVPTELQAGVNGQIRRGRRGLSVRELEVLELASLGLTDMKIGERMHISHETVRTNLMRCKEKLGVSGRTALVATAMRMGLLD